jgi:hypothetical protein
MSDNKEERQVFRSNQMTLKPTQKIRRKNKKTKLQELYNEGKVTSEEFYEELIKFIKWRLMTDLIRRGYYINGVRQANFTRDECDACYTHVLSKILNEYSAEKGTLATYVRWQIRGWGQLVIQKQVRNHKYNPKGMVSLDSNKIYNVKLEEYKNRCRLPEDMECALDYEYFGNSILNDISKLDIVEIREKIKVFKNIREYFEWLE